jgi:hypothetical protein
VLLLLGDGTQVQVTELPGDDPWTFLVLGPDPEVEAGRGGAARFLTRFGRPAVPDLRGRPGGGPGWAGIAPDAPPR